MEGPIGENRGRHGLARLLYELVFRLVELLQEPECLQPQLVGHVQGSFEASDEFVDSAVDDLWLKLPTSHLPR